MRYPAPRVLEFWGSAIGADNVGRVLQLAPTMDATRWRELKERFQRWYAWTVDLPGTYYLQVVQQLFKENQIAEGRFVALGRQIDLAEIRIPVLLLAGTQDELISIDQLFAVSRLVGTPQPAIEMMTEPCDHLGLFLGAKSLARSWPKIAHWLSAGRAIKRPREVLTSRATFRGSQPPRAGGGQATVAIASSGEWPLTITSPPSRAGEALRGGGCSWRRHSTSG